MREKLELESDTSKVREGKVSQWVTMNTLEFRGEFVKK